MIEKKSLGRLGLTEGEFREICQLMEREPNELELALFGVMWSEHCSYKSSRTLLKKFPVAGPGVLQGPGENAGAVDIGEGKAVVFKIESHNHPSAIEPYQGAATGVGGIVRDIFSMGARPVALLNSLRFGPIEEPRTRYLFQGVVKGIGDYGNCIGVPTVGGETFFHSSYLDNPLVNAMCVGIIEKDQLTRASSTNPSALIMVVGSRTGRDGMGGASFASDQLCGASEKDRPAVQVGDPFMEKLLLEACLELIEKELVEGIQDLGAAGLTSSSAEVSFRSGMGMEINVEQVPRREKGMNPMEVMLSESQERMLIIPKKNKDEEIKGIFSRWGLEAAVIGRMIPEPDLVIKENGETKGRIPSSFLADQVPLRDLQAKTPSKIKKPKKSKPPDCLKTAFFKLLESPNLASKEWVFEQFDYMVGTDSLCAPGGGAALVRIPGSKKALAISVDGNSRYCSLDPFRGGEIALVESARNIWASGAKPLAVTDCLNFGNPEKPIIYWQLEQAVTGIAGACRALDIPVVSGNVSLYNETEGNSINPTPIVGMVGLLDDINQVIPSSLQEDENLIFLLGKTRGELNGSEYEAYIWGKEEGFPPEVDLALESKTGRTILQANQKGLLNSAQDLAEGGLGLAIAEMAVRGNRGAKIELPGKLPAFVELFSESQGRYLVTCSAENRVELEKLFKNNEINCVCLGIVQGSSLKFNGYFEASIKEMENAWRGCLGRWMD